ncbi:MAG: hypothetical protein AAF740_01490, partial [Bacteroidota bacterium]
MRLNFTNFFFQKLLLLLIFSGFSNLIYGQCSVVYTSATGQNTPICVGDQVNFVLTAGSTSFDFNTGSIPTGWSVGGGFNVGTVSCAPPSPTNDPYYWASTSTATTPFIETNDLDVSAGGDIEFDMIYSIQSDPAPCEGPDLPDEGVELQYSTDMGNTWVPIIYWDPSPGSVGTWPFTGAWNSFTIPIPLGAQT